MPQTKEWTLMFYFASDNPLAPSVVSQLKAIKDAGFHPEANVVARYDPHTEETPTHVFDVNRVAKLRYPGRSRVGFANDPYVRNLVLDKLWGDDNEADRDIRKLIQKALSRSHGGDWNANGGRNGDGNGNGDGRGEPGRGAAEFDSEMPVLPKEFSRERPPRQALEDFLRFCADKYPARHYMLFILGHGVIVGNDFFLFDEHVGGAAEAPAAAADVAKKEEGEGSVGEGGAARADGAPPPQAAAAAPAAKSRERSTNALSLKGLGEVLREFSASLPEESRFELLGFHSCSMSGLEVAYELRGTANYLLASQGPAFVGSWPYRQILMRVFNDLNSPLLTVGDLADGRLAARLRAGGDPAAEFLRGRLSARTLELLELEDDAAGAGLELTRGLAGDLNAVLRRGALLSSEAFAAASNGSGDGRPARAADARRRGRALLERAFTDEIAEGRRLHPRDVKDLVTRIFYYILYNSYDFQLAGYSFDLCLCDLTKVGEAGEAVARLSAALKAALAGDAGLGGGGKHLGRELILLAHWDAQSFWQESYTDLYDFCFRLKRRCQHVFPELKALDEDPQADARPEVPAEVVRACRQVMEKLERGEEGDDDRIVVRADFAGAEYQYSHGLSVFFPWARPGGGFFEETYSRTYEFASETSWHEFLRDYFDKTLRETNDDESVLAAPGVGARAAAGAADDTDSDGELERKVLEELLVAVGNRVFSEGQLDGPGGGHIKGGPDDPLGPGGGGHIKGGPDDPLGPGGGHIKGGPDDPLGLGLLSPTFKNYPSFTGKSPKDEPARAEEEKPPCDVLESQAYSRTFFQGLKKR